VAFHPSGFDATGNGGTNLWPAGAVWLDAGADGYPDTYAVIRFTTPTGGGGVYGLSSSVSPTSAGMGGDCDFHVALNGVEAYGVVLGPDDGGGYTNGISLESGEVVDFVVGPGDRAVEAVSELQINATLVGPGVAISLPPLVPPSDYNLARDYATNTNPNGAWSSGWKNKLGGQFQTYTALTHPPTDNNILEDTWETWYGSSDINYNPSPVNGVGRDGPSLWPAGSVWFGPGADGAVDKYGTVRFTAPPGGGGSYLVTATVQPTTVGPQAGDSDFHVETNGVEDLAVFLSPTESAEYTKAVSLPEGGTVDFMIGPGADGLQEGSELQISVEIIAPVKLQNIRTTMGAGGKPFPSFSWNSPGSITDEVQRSDILGAQWTTISTILAATGLNTFTDSTVSGTNSYFYRLKFSWP
jgi:hypothetical protein